MSTARNRAAAPCTCLPHGAGGRGVSWEPPDRLLGARSRSLLGAYFGIICGFVHRKKGHNDYERGRVAISPTLHLLQVPERSTASPVNPYTLEPKLDPIPRVCLAGPRAPRSPDEDLNKSCDVSSL